MRRKHGDAELTVLNGGINFIKQPVPRLHIFAIQERIKPQPWEVIVKQACNGPLCVGSPMINEHIAWSTGKRQLDLVVRTMMNDFTAQAFGWWITLHGTFNKLLSFYKLIIIYLLMSFFFLSPPSIWFCLYGVVGFGFEGKVWGVFIG